jgi:FemAB-related protein (PEP-CTERM system-associated)
VIEETFGHKPYYLAAVENGTIFGILPLFGVQTRLFGCSLVSVPFFTYGGILTDRSDVQDELLEKAIELAGEINAKQVELRHVHRCGDWPHICAKVTMEITLPSTPDEYLKTLGSGMRKKVRYACRHSLVPQWGGIELIPEFYDVFAANMRDLGTPVYPMSFFVNQIRRSPQTIRILLLREGKRAVFAAFLSCFRSKLELPWAASLAAAREKYSQLPLYWRFIEWAILNGYTKLDLGRCTPNSGPHQFKHHWNCVEHALNWQYWHSPGASVGQLRPENPKYQLAVALWKRLPLAVANTVGPRIVRGLP